MQDSSEYSMTRRLKATLANFHSYCQKRSQQHSQIRQVRSKSNKSITKYRSTRELRKLSENKLQVTKASKGKDNKDEAEEVMQMKTSDLIEIIKLKLNNNQGIKMKTVGNEGRKEGKSWKVLKKLNSFELNQFNRSFNLNDTLKKKNLNLLVQNSRRKQAQKPIVRQRTVESFNVTFQNRPSSAFIKASQFSKEHQQPQNELGLKQKYSCQLLLRYQRKSSNYNKKADKKKQALSGWDWPLDDDLLSIQNMKQRSLENKRKKST